MYIYFCIDKDSRKINIQRFIYHISMICIVCTLSGTGFDRDTVSHNDMTTFKEHASVPN